MKVDISHLAMEIDFQTSEHAVTMEKVAEQCLSTKCFGHSFTFVAPTVLNDLPDEVHSAPTLACFRKRLKAYLFKKAFST